MQIHSYSSHKNISLEHVDRFYNTFAVPKKPSPLEVKLHTQLKVPQMQDLIREKPENDVSDKYGLNRKNIPTQLHMKRYVLKQLPQETKLTNMIAASLLISTVSYATDHPTVGTLFLGLSGIHAYALTMTRHARNRVMEVIERRNYTK